MKTLVFVSCSKRKKFVAPNIKINADELYQGFIFKSVKKWCKDNNFDRVIISAKYGFLKPDDLINTYDMKLTTKRQIRVLQEKHSAAIYKYLKMKQYDRIIIIMGQKYTDVIRPALKQFEQLEDKQILRLTTKPGGIYDMNRNLKKLINGNFNVLTNQTY